MEANSSETIRKKRKRGPPKQFREGRKISFVAPGWLADAIEQEADAVAAGNVSVVCRDKLAEAFQNARPGAS